jgi:hypothetical protein
MQTPENFFIMEDMAVDFVKEFGQEASDLMIEMPGYLKEHKFEVSAENVADFHEVVQAEVRDVYGAQP